MSSSPSTKYDSRSGRHSTPYTAQTKDDGCTSRPLWCQNQSKFEAEIFTTYHDAPTAGHPGIWKTQIQLGRDYWWPSMRQDVKAYVLGCLKCQATKTITHRNQPPLQPITPTSDVPFGTIALDFITKLPKSGGCDTILTITDHDCTKAVILVPCKEAMRTEEFLELYRERVFPYAGIPKKVISDRDVRFTSDIFKEMCKQLAITAQHEHRVSPPDGWAVGTHKPECGDNPPNLLQPGPGQLARVVACHPVHLELPTICHDQEDSLRSLDGSSTPSTPARASQHSSPVPGTNAAAIPGQEGGQGRHHAAQQLQETGGSYTAYKVGDKVWLEGKNLRTTHPTHKLREKRFGPFPVQEVLGKVNYRLEIPGHWKIHNVFHAAVLHPCKETTMNPNRYDEPPPDLIDGEEEWEVEKILDTRRSGRRKDLQFLVQWKGYSSAHNSWEPASEVHAPELIEEFYARQPRAARRAHIPVDLPEFIEGSSTTPMRVMCRRIQVFPVLADNVPDPVASPQGYITPSSSAENLAESLGCRAQSAEDPVILSDPRIGSPPSSPTSPVMSLSSHASSFMEEVQSSPRVPFNTPEGGHSPSPSMAVTPVPSPVPVLGGVSPCQQPSCSRCPLHPLTPVQFLSQGRCPPLLSLLFLSRCRCHHPFHLQILRQSLEGGEVVPLAPTRAMLRDIKIALLPSPVVPILGVTPIPSTPMSRPSPAVALLRAQYLKLLLEQLSSSTRT